jgi:hypothetical protein
VILATSFGSTRWTRDRASGDPNRVVRGGRTQLSQSVERPPSGPQWVHEIKLDGYRMAARLDNGRVQLLTRNGLDWNGTNYGRSITPGLFVFIEILRFVG